MSKIFKQNAPVAASPSQLNGLQIQKTGYGNTLPIVYGTAKVSGNLIYYNDFKTIPQTTSTSAGKGGGTAISNTSYSYSATIAFSLAEGPINGVSTLWRNNQKFTNQTEFGLTIFPGTYPQMPWGYLVTNHPTEAVGYQGIAYAAGANYNLGTGSLGNHLFEVQGILWTPENPDCNPKDVIVDFLTNENYGVLFPPEYLGDFSAVADYCEENGILISPALEAQRPAQEWLTEWTTIANSGVVWSEKKLKIIPYDAEPVVAYNLSEDDFLTDGADDPIQVERTRQADAFNAVNVEFLNRENEYTQEPSEVKDQASIEKYGLRVKSTDTFHSICVGNVAKFVAQSILQRQLYIRNTYKFKLSWKYCLLEPMDIVTLTDLALGLNLSPVRITSIEESEDGSLAIEAEEYDPTYAKPVQYAQPPANGYMPNFGIVPAAYTSPLIFLAPSQLAPSGYELWMSATNPDPEYGGSQVWLSYDDATYFQIGKVSATSIAGETTTSLPAGSDPDVSNVLGIDLSISKGSLITVNQTEVDTFTSLCLAGNEFISYRDVTLTGVNQYDLSYLRRGVYNSTQGSASGSRFIKCDNNLFKYPYNPALYGTTVYFKFVAYNKVGSGLQDISVVPAFPFLITGQLSLPGAPASFSVTQTGSSVQFSWAASTTPSVTYEIRYIPQGSGYTWQDGVVLTTAIAATSSSTTGMPPGAWTFMLASKDTGGNYSATKEIQSYTVLDTLTVQDMRQEAPIFSGTLTNLVKHWTGKVVPQSQNLASADGFDTFDKLVPNPYGTCYFEGAQFDLGSSKTVRGWAAFAGTLPIPGGVNIPQLWLSSSTDGATYTSFTQWGNAFFTGRYIKARAVINTSIGTPCLSLFTPTFDM